MGPNSWPELGPQDAHSRRRNQLPQVVFSLHTGVTPTYPPGTKGEWNKSGSKNFVFGLGQNFQQVLKQSQTWIYLFYPTYLCTVVFSAFTIIRSKCPSSLKYSDGVLHPVLSDVQPKFNSLFVAQIIKTQSQKLFISTSGSLVC